jgi:hypothetical protein
VKAKLDSFQLQEQEDATIISLDIEAMYPLIKSKHVKNLSMDIS